jgi:enoyl-[acyl-carrier protein] reductase I
MSGLDLLADCRGLVLGVSGANSVGYHCARLLAAHGATVAITYRPARAPACGPLLAAGGLARGLEVDVQDEASIQAAVECIGAEWGRIDFIVHAIVGVPEGTLGRPLLALTREEYREVMEVTAYSLIAACRHAAPWMTRSAHPRVVALTSPAAQRTTPNYHAVGIAKAALSTALLYLGAELGPRGILCNGVGFSLIETDGARRAVGEKLAAATRTSLQKRAPTRQAVEYEHIARTVAFLASPLCANMTGEILTVDGGFSRIYL